MDISKKKPKRLIGIEILRTYLCFRIVLLHYYSSNNNYINKLRKNNLFQVPCFFFISFYFFYPIISTKNVSKMKIRLERLFIPYIIYPNIVWIINNLMLYIINFSIYNRYLNLNELKTQIIVGKGIFGLGTFWFLFNLLILTFIFLIASFLIQKNYLLFFQIISLISYIIQYSRINYTFFLQYTSTIYLTIGSLIETFPLAIAAFSFSSNNIFQILSKKNKTKCIFFCLFVFYLLLNYDVFTKLTGYSSPGIKPMINSIMLLTIFYLTPFEKINSKILKFITQITKYTQGIYCLHCLLVMYMRRYFEKDGTFYGTIILYIICYFISFIGFKIFGKTKIKFLFI